MAKKNFKVKVTTLTPFYTGEVREEEKKIYKDSKKIAFPVRKTATGKAIFPFKGALRATLETLLKKEGKNVCDTGITSARPCGHCATCVLFGSMGKKGKVITDFLISELDKDQIIRISTHVRLNRQNGTVSDTFKGEEVVEGAVFNGKIVIENCKPEDEELIRRAVKEIEQKGIGGWINKGYGRIKIELIEE